MGLPQVLRYHYTPGMHETNSIGELGFTLDVWKSFTPQQQEAANSAVKDTFITWITRWQKQNADAMEEMVQKHGARILRTPPDILLASLKAWDEVAKENSDKSPTFKKVYESQREYAAKVVPAKRYLFPPYSFAANYYWPQTDKPAAGKKAASRRRPGGWRYSAYVLQRSLNPWRAASASPFANARAQWGAGSSPTRRQA